MDLKEKTKLLKEYCKAVTQNYMKLGELLKEIRDKRLYEESHENFTEYLNGNDFEFTRQYAYKLIKVFEEFGNVNSSLHLTKLLALTHVSDKEEREELLERTKDMSVSETKQEVDNINTEYLAKKNIRAEQREDGDLLTKSDSHLDKGRRIANEILEMSNFVIVQVETWIKRVDEWNKTYGQKFPVELDKLKGAILVKLKEVKEI